MRRKKNFIFTEHTLKRTACGEHISKLTEQREHISEFSSFNKFKAHRKYMCKCVCMLTRPKYEKYVQFILWLDAAAAAAVLFVIFCQDDVFLAHSWHFLEYRTKKIQTFIEVFRKLLAFFAPSVARQRTSKYEMLANSKINLIYINKQLIERLHEGM